MQGTTKHKTTIVVFFLLLIFSSCSTKKKSWVNRQYHNTSAKYNGYFNGNESLKSGVFKIHKNHKDDYTTILNIFPETNLEKSKKTHTYMDKAIQKGSIVIQRHSMKIEGKEYCKWIDDNYLMIGKAYFYKGNFDESSKTFAFIKSEYENNEIKLLASLWLLRSYIEKEDFSSAKKEMTELNSYKEVSKKTKALLASIYADYYIRINDFVSAKKELINSLQLIKGKRNKVRHHYVLAQIYQQEKQYAEAHKHFQQVLKSSPDYEMAFNAKMNIARTFSKENKGADKMKQELLKMTKDDKNKEYLDQIYYTIAELNINTEDTTSALNNYNLSSLYSIENNTQKAISYLAAAKLNFYQKKYFSSKSLYDSTIKYMDENYRLFLETKEEHEIVSALALNLETVALQDSLQELSRLSPSEQKRIVQQIIQKEIAEEKRLSEEKRLKKQAAYQSSLDNRRGNQFGTNTSGGKWYFYNPATLSFGLSEFRKKWGSRKLEDDWRRKDKKSLNIGQDTLLNDTTKAETQNTKDPKYYLSQIPSSEQDLYLSDQKIKEALYNLGMLYKQSLNKTELSSQSFLEIFNRYPKDNEYSSLALYSVYNNYKGVNEKKRAETKKLLISSFPKSVYTKMILDSNYQHVEQNEENKEVLKYKEVLTLYNSEKYDQVLLLTKAINESTHKPKLLLLRALSQISLSNTEGALATLKTIDNKDDLVLAQATHLIESINDPTRIQEANEVAKTGSSYLYRKNTPHMIVLTLAGKGVDMTFLKTLISDFHMKNIGNEVFEVSSLLLGIDQHLLIIKPFENANESMEYFMLFEAEQKIKRELNKTEHNLFSISLENFRQFYEKKDISGYKRFFSTNYN